jgi:RNA polymerase sigma-70 factor (ECF subfamily)
MDSKPTDTRGNASMAQSDAELIERAIRREADAFAALVQRYAPLAHAIAFSHTGRRDVAEELAQEAFCRAFVGLNGLRKPNQFRSWLWGITRRVCLDWRRQMAQSKELTEVPRDTPSPDDPAREVEHEERRRRVRRAVEELPEKYRIVVQLRHLEGLSYEDIASALGLSLGGVSNRLAAAREMLRAKLRPLMSE